ncbi:MAG: hypothetical protein ACTTK1_07775, partial [Candidatus Cryptobacteroides sp.]
DASEMESCGSYDSDADETFFFDWEDFEGGDTCVESGVSCGGGISEAYSEDRAKGISSYGVSDTDNGFFEASENDVQTKTEYSGHKENVGSKNYERIDWVVGDKVKIFANGVKPSKTECVYEVSHVNPSGSRSSAGLRPFNEADGHGLMWDSGNADFYAFYPGNNPAKVFASNNTPSNFEVTVKLPKEQNTFTKITSGNHIEFKPDMELAAMMAVSRNVSPTSSVQLDFLPLVTTFRITMSNSLPNDDMKINKVSLVYSPSAPTPVSPLSGDYAVKYDKASGSTLSSHSSGGLQPVNPASILNPAQEISVNLGTDAVTLTKNNGNTLSVTLFAVPVSHKGIQLKVNFTVNGKTEDNLLDLKQKSPGDWLEFEPYKKYDIRIGAGKNWIFHLEATDISVSYSGGVVSSKMKSYKTYGSKTKPVPWHVVGYSNIGKSGPFTDPCPSWLTGFPSNGSGVSYPMTYEIVSASISAQEGSLTTPNARNTALRGKNEVGSQADPIDLSKVPVGNSPFFSIADGTTASTYASKPMNTANCYVVTRPGWYKIPVVYGNALKNGNVNTSAYTSSASGSNVLQNFIRHDGQAITKPWIKENINLNSGVAELLWQDQPNLVQNIQLESNKKFIVFHVNQSTIHEGNAVIALKASATGDIVWSWHIWVYGGNDLKAINVKNNRAKSGGRPGQDNFNFLSENLGACHDSGESMIYPESNVWVKVSNDKKTKVIKITRTGFTISYRYNNPYYQWGRKDPTLPSDGTTLNKNKVWYNKAGVQSDELKIDKWESDGSASGANAEIANTIKHPQTFNESYYMDNLYYNLWDSSCNETTSFFGDRSVTTARFEAVKKSVYDPCPPGFCLSPNGALTGTTRSGNITSSIPDLNVSGSFNEGYNLRTVLLGESGGTTIFFPALGFRESFHGIELNYIGSFCFYWSSSVQSEQCGDCLDLRNGYSNTMNYNNRLNGLSVRPVAEN